MSRPSRFKFGVLFVAAFFCIALALPSNAQPACSECSDGCSGVGYVLGVPVSCGIQFGSCTRCLIVTDHHNWGYTLYWCYLLDCSRGDVQTAVLPTPTAFIACESAPQPFVLKRAESMTRPSRS